MALAGSITYDGFFDVAQEIEGTAMISTDPITRSLIVVRSYVVKKAFYQPLLYTNPALIVPVVPIPDYQYPTAILVEENAGQSIGPMFYFTRIFAEVPVLRTEPRLVAFARPGITQAQLSPYSRLPIGWNQYGGGQPYTRLVLGTATFTYKSNPNDFVVPSQTVVLYKGAPVDFVGDVYVYSGNRQVNINPIFSGLSPPGGTTLFEPNWTLEGTTAPPTLPASWVIEPSIDRWRGTIWQMTVVTVPTTPS